MASSAPHAGPQVDQADGLDAAELDLIERPQVGRLLLDLALDRGDALLGGVAVGEGLAALGVVGEGLSSAAPRASKRATELVVRATRRSRVAISSASSGTRTCLHSATTNSAASSHE